ncbi:hypothetical protein HK105_204294 [Polyrhizophydium stewartii]|uniref:1-alkyl-2-acetylglycerophosphocholine esterase n=1 Tax=Polyrhizophydium stewartii TaxID=2732419 RepID=A0ABR4N9L8_9FUNG|nr:Platelet-activating factor acetylhydrolase [Polyrhizophydium stewartii]
MSLARDAAAAEAGMPGSVTAPLTSAQGGKLHKPASWSLSARLPDYNGPFKVGVVDIETAPTAAVDKGLLARVFYPTTDAPTAPQCEAAAAAETSSQPRHAHAHARRPAPAHHAQWLPKRLLYSIGYGDFLGLPAALAVMFVAPSLSGVTMPAFLNAPLRPASAGAGAGGHTHALPERLPVVVFSHGLAGMRTTYSTLCGCLAAKGFVVIAPEHGDGSGSTTARNGYKTRILYRRPHKSEIRPGQTQDEYLKELRNGQVEYRANEALEAVDLLRKLDAGHFDGASENLLHAFDGGFDFRQFAGRLDLRNVAMIGHSFGGATAIAALSRPNHPFACGVMLDPWMFPVKNPNVTVPFLTIQSETFHWRQNLTELSSMFRSSATHPSSRFAYIRGTAHNDPSDLAGLFPGVLRMGGQVGTGDPLFAQLVNDEWITEFVRTFMPSCQLALPSFRAYSVDNPVGTPDAVVSGDRAIQDLFARLDKQ